MPAKPKIGDEAVKEATGKIWREWFSILGKAGAAEMDHKQIVAWLSRHYQAGDWWTQMVAVTYEQAKGLRDPHQKPDGYEISGSKTVGVPIASLFEAFVNDKKRESWLGDVLSVRKATKPKSARFDFKGGTLVSANFSAKGEGKSQVGVNHGKIKDAGQAAQMKRFWAAKLEGLRAMLEE